nr:hypothetical protein [Bacillus wiedmannii]
MPTDIHLPPKIGVSHLHIFEEGVFCWKTIKNIYLIPYAAYGETLAGIIVSFFVLKLAISMREEAKKIVKKWETSKFVIVNKEVR